MSQLHSFFSSSSLLDFRFPKLVFALTGNQWRNYVFAPEGKARLNDAHRTLYGAHRTLYGAQSPTLRKKTLRSDGESEYEWQD